jgi:hypothetical protein
MKSGNLNFLEPSGHLGAVMGLIYLYLKMLDPLPLPGWWVLWPVYCTSPVCVMTRVAFYLDFSAETYFRCSFTSSIFFWNIVSEKCIEYPFVTVGNEIMLYFECFGISVYTEPQTFHLGSVANMMVSTQNHTCNPGRDFIHLSITLYKTGHWKQTTRKKLRIMYSSFCKLFWTYMVTYHYSTKGSWHLLVHFEWSTASFISWSWFKQMYLWILHKNW